MRTMTRRTALVTLSVHVGWCSALLSASRGRGGSGWCGARLVRVQAEPNEGGRPFDGLSCRAFKTGALASGQQARRLAAFAGGAALRDAARVFVERKNRGDLEAIFGDLAADADVYGLTGGAIVPGLTAFFADHRGLHHELVGEPRALGPTVVEYEFVKSWTDADGVQHVWRSKDPAKPRDKVERLRFDAAGAKLRSVHVVDAATAVDDDGDDL